MAVTREAIVQASLGILDSYGLADLSMRRIGDALGVQAATIYWHYANKQSLLAGISDAILADLGAPTDEPLAPALREWAHELRRVLLKHRDAAELVAATLAVGLGVREPDDPAVALLLAAGWPMTDASRAARALTHFILGHVMQEQTRVNLIELGVLAEPAQARDDGGFDLGLDLLVTGILTRPAPDAAG